MVQPSHPALVRMLGYDSEDELLDLDVARDIYMDPDHRGNWTRAMQETGEVRNAELVLKRKDGSKIVVLENSRAVSDAVSVPVIASGGVGNLDHLADGVQQGGADAVLAASIFHYGEYTVAQAKARMAERGIPVRL
mgnify:CR=1 FL=1